MYIHMFKEVEAIVCVYINVSNEGHVVSLCDFLPVT